MIGGPLIRGAINLVGAGRKALIWRKRCGGWRGCLAAARASAAASQAGRASASHNMEVVVARTLAHRVEVDAPLLVARERIAASGIKRDTKRSAVASVEFAETTMLDLPQVEIRYGSYRWIR